jgi:DNA-binding NarL/FixJ family response regulator
MSSPHDITVVIIDRHWIVAEGLAQVLRLESDIDVVGVATNVGEGFELVSRHLPDVVVVDEELHDGNGFEATARFTSVSGTSKILILAASRGHDVVTRARLAGSAGVLSREHPCQEIIDSVRAVAEHSPILPPLDTAELVNGWSPTSPKRTEQLTSRELEILHLLAGAYSAKQIARELDVSVHTVKNHTYNIFLKLGAHSRIEAIAKGIAKGILEPGDIGASPALAVG